MSSGLENTQISLIEDSESPHECVSKKVFVCSVMDW